MTNTTAHHNRFWLSMSERYGKRWTEEYGPTPSKAWVEMLDKFTPKQIAAALVKLANESPIHPPTLPQLERLLAVVSRAGTDDAVDFVRGYWRSSVVFMTEYELLRENAITRCIDTEEYIRSHSATIGNELRRLMDELVDMENANRGQRTAGMYLHCQKTVQAIIRHHTAAVA